MCLTVSLSATVALVCLYMPKVYIIVFHPDKNVRKLTMTATYRKGPSSTRQGTPSGAGTNTGGSAVQGNKASNHSGNFPMHIGSNLIKSILMNPLRKSN